MKQSTKITNKQDRLYYCISYIVVTILTLIVLYPVIYVVAASFSDVAMVTQGKVWLWPVDFNFDAYRMLFANKDLWVGYGNTIFYTVVGTLINIVVTIMCAYPMARKNLRGRSTIMFLFSFTMIFSGGMIPNYILMRNLGLLNTRWVMLLPGAMSVYNMIVCRTYIETNIPQEMLEAAQIDGCTDFQFLLKMVLPLSKPIIAVLALWYAVSHWNSYFSAFLYLKDSDLYPLQLFLREILFASKRVVETDEMLAEGAETNYQMYTVLQYAVIVFSTFPLMCIYPFVQKHFQKGIMVGSVKG